MSRQNSPHSHLYHRKPIARYIDDENAVDSLVKIAQHIQRGARVLDVGCSVGMLGQYLTTELSCSVDGIDSNADALELARPFYRMLHQLDLDSTDLAVLLSPQSYDVIVFADVLEHLRAPDETLNQARQLLANGGRILISIPNVSYVGLIAELLDGKFQYRDEGLLDHTHVRFFTAESISELIERAEMDAFALDTVELALQESEFDSINPSQLSAAEVQTLNSAHNGGVYQFIFEARLRDAAGSSSKADLIHLQRGPTLKFRPAIYWAGTSDGFAEERSSHVELPMDGELHEAHLTIRKGENTFIRFDPADIEGVVQICNLDLLDDAGRTIWSWDNSNFMLSTTPSLNIDFKAPTSASEPTLLRCMAKDNYIVLPLTREQALAASELKALLGWKPYADYLSTEDNLNDLAFDKPDVSHDGTDPQETELPPLVANQAPTEADRLIGDLGARLTNELDIVSSQLHEVATEAGRLKRELVEIHESHSWRITAPLRRLSSLSKGVLSNYLLNGKPPAALSRIAERIPPVSNLIQHRRAIAEEKSLPILSDYEESFQRWLTLHGELSQQDVLEIQRQMLTWDYKPTISILMPVYRPDLKYLELAIESVYNQLYTHWQLNICDDGSKDPQLSKYLREVAKKDARITITTRDTNGGIANATNDALTAATGEFVALMDQDDELAPEALYWITNELQSDPQLVLLYSDEDKMDEAGNRYDPYFKPDFNSWLLLGQNYCNHLTVVKRSALNLIDGFRSEFTGSQDWDMLLRLTDNVKPDRIRHIPWILYHWRALSSSTAKTIASKPYAIDVGLKAVTEALARRGIDATPIRIGNTGYVRPTFELRNHGSVSILIPTRDNVGLLRTCIESLAKTEYPDYQIIVIDNQSIEPDTLEYLCSLERQGIRVLRYNLPFNYAAMHNWAVPQLDSKFICLMNNDIEVISPDWLTQMVQLANTESTGAVGAQLLFTDNTIQHAGVHLGTGGVAGHPFKHTPHDAGGYFGRTFLLQEYSAVTAACMVVRKEVWDLAGGMDEKLRVAYNDVDFCLKLKTLGFANVYSPSSKLFHHESKSRGSDFNSARFREFASENAYMKWKWHHLLSNDPFTNPNLDSRHERVVVAPESRVQLPWHPRPRLLAAPVGLGAYGEHIPLMPQSRLSSIIYSPRDAGHTIVQIWIALSGQSSPPLHINASLTSLSGRDTELRYLGARNTHLPEPAWLVFGTDDTPIELNGDYAVTINLFLPASEPRIDLAAAFSGEWSGQIAGWPDRTLIAKLRFEQQTT